MSEPLYKTVYRDMLNRIATGAYPAGAMLPSEFDLADEFNVSQGTARKALTELEQKGIVARRQGRGTFVTLQTPENALFSFFRLRDRKGQQVIPVLESQTIAKRRARAFERNALHDRPSDVYEISRVRSFEGRNICHETVIVSTVMFPGLPERMPLPNTLYVLFQRNYSCVIITAQEELRAITVDEQRASALNVEPGTTAIAVERRGFDLLDRCVELRTSTILTETVSYAITLS